MPIIHKRTQYGVGKGSFHCGQFFENDTRSRHESTLGAIRAQPDILRNLFSPPLFTYIYDCGGRRALIEPALDEISNSCNAHLDMLVLSHFDYDHVGHMPTLMRSFESVNYVILPLLSAHEKLVLQFEYINMHDDGGHSFDGKDDFNHFVDDPTTWFQDRGAAHVIFIRGGEPPEIIGPESTPPIGAGGTEFGAKNRGFLNPKTALTPGSQMLGDGENFPLVLPTPSTDTSPWMFRFHTRHAAAQEVDNIIARLANRLNVNLDNLSLDQKKQEITAAITNYLRVGRRTTHVNRPFFEALGTDAANRYSLCMYSGPPARKRNQIGWMATGDAVLHQQGRTGSFSEFSTHYTGFIRNVMTLQAPHHGSHHNASPALHHTFRQRIWTSSAKSQPNHYNHPHPSVVDACMSTGSPFIQVNERAAFGTMPPDALQDTNWQGPLHENAFVMTTGRDYVEIITMP